MPKSRIIAPDVPLPSADSAISSNSVRGRRLSPPVSATSDDSADLSRCMGCRPEACFRLAIETARRQQSRGWELRAVMSLARLWQRQGRRDDARAALAAIYGTYSE